MPRVLLLDACRCGGAYRHGTSGAEGLGSRISRGLPRAPGLLAECCLESLRGLLTEAALRGTMGAALEVLSARIPAIAVVPVGGLVHRKDPGAPMAHNPDVGFLHHPRTRGLDDAASITDALHSKPGNG